jgi:hypothetical protein
MSEELEYMAKALENVEKFTDIIADKLHRKTFSDLEKWMDYQRADHERFDGKYNKRLTRLENMVEAILKQLNNKE